MAKPAFAAVEITGCDPEKVERASKHAKQFVFPFSLSAKPDDDWADIFGRLWDARRKKATPRKLRAGVAKDEIRLECSLSDVKLVFGDVKQCVADANKRYVEELREKAEKNAKKKQKEEAERLSLLNAVREALDGLDYSPDSTRVASAKPKKTKSEKPRNSAED